MKHNKKSELNEAETPVLNSSTNDSSPSYLINYNTELPVLSNEANTKIKALISLLDDPDELVYDSVKAEILSSKFEIIPELQTAFHASEDELKSERLAEVLNQLKLEKLTLDIENWRKNEQPELIEGMLHIARYGYPDFDANEVIRLINKIIQSVKSKIEGKSSREIADIFNQVILHDFGFNGNYKEYSAANNSFINKTIETKASNPIGLSVLYLLVAKATGIPLVGINSPGHFILGYLTTDDDEMENLTDKIAFFIDPFNNGNIVENDHFKVLLKSKAVPQEALDSLIATEKAIIKRVFNNLIYALYTSGEKTTAEKLLLVAESI